MVLGAVRLECAGAELSQGLRFALAITRTTPGIINPTGLDQQGTGGTKETLSTKYLAALGEKKSL